MSKQTKAIMVLEEYGQTDNYVIFYPEDGGEFDEEGVRFDMDRETYDDMGEPNEITVTVVPGYRIEDNEPIVLDDYERGILDRALDKMEGIGGDDEPR